MSFVRLLELTGKCSRLVDIVRSHQQDTHLYQISKGFCDESQKTAFVCKSSQSVQCRHFLGSSLCPPVLLPCMCLQFCAWNVKSLSFARLSGSVDILFLPACLVQEWGLETVLLPADYDQARLEGVKAVCFLSPVVVQY